MSEIGGYDAELDITHEVLEARDVVCAAVIEDVRRSKDPKFRLQSASNVAEHTGDEEMFAIAHELIHGLSASTSGLKIDDSDKADYIEALTKQPNQARIAEAWELTSSMQKGFFQANMWVMLAQAAHEQPDIQQRAVAHAIYEAGQSVVAGKDAALSVLDKAAMLMEIADVLAEPEFYGQAFDRIPSGYIGPLMLFPHQIRKKIERAATPEIRAQLVSEATRFFGRLDYKHAHDVFELWPVMDDDEMVKLVATLNPKHGYFNDAELTRYIEVVEQNQLVSQKEINKLQRKAARQRARNVRKYPFMTQSHFLAWDLLEVGYDGPDLLAEATYHVAERGPQALDDSERFIAVERLIEYSRTRHTSSELELARQIRDSYAPFTEKRQDCNIALMRAADVPAAQEVAAYLVQQKPWQRANDWTSDWEYDLFLNRIDQIYLHKPY